MHYSDGTPVLIGDIVKADKYDGHHALVGIVIGGVPSSMSCNVYIAAFSNVNLNAYGTGHTYVGGLTDSAGHRVATGVVRVGDFTVNSQDLTKLDHVPLGVLPTVAPHPEKEPDGSQG